LAACESDIIASAELLAETFASGGKLLVAGNGGSAADALHIVGELMKGFVLPRQIKDCEKAGFDHLPDREILLASLQGALPAVSLINESALVTAFANDRSSELVFAQQVYGLGRHGDAFLGISTSGRARNILYACQAARAAGTKVIGLTGGTGGGMRELCDVCITVPENETYRVQELHLPVYHAICLALENEFFGED
jgi:D-sedoheptulose 7-phosphate isomerase